MAWNCFKAYFLEFLEIVSNLLLNLWRSPVSLSFSYDHWQRSGQIQWFESNLLTVAKRTGRVDIFYVVWVYTVPKLLLSVTTGADGTVYEYTHLCMVYICADIHVNKSQSYSVASTPDLTGLVFMRKFMGGSVLGTCLWGSQTDLSMWICPLAFLQAEPHPPRPLPHPPHEERLPPPLEAIYTTQTSFSANHDF